MVLRLHNRGRSDVIWWRIALKAEVSAGNHLAEQFNIAGESCAWSIEHQDYKDVIALGEKIEIVVAKTGVFPRVEFQWTIEYRDMRNVSYSRFGGDTHLVDVNVLADPTSG